MLSRLQSTASTAKARSMETLDTRLPPQRRQELYQSAQAWATAHPKLAAFLAAHILLSIPPILLFLAYTTTTFLAALFTALTLALAFTACCTALAALVLLPVLLCSSAAATALFLAVWAAHAAATRLASDPRLAPARQGALDAVRSASTKAQDAALLAGRKANDLSGGRVEAALGEGQKALGARGGEDVASSSGVATPVSLPPAYGEQAQTPMQGYGYGAATPPGGAHATYEVDMPKATPNAVAERTAQRVVEASRLQGQLSDAEKVGIARMSSRPALF